MNNLLTSSILVALCAACAVHGKQPDGGVGAVTGIKWQISPTQKGDAYRVTLSRDNMPENSFIALGLSLSAGMPKSFIIACAKLAGGQPLAIQQRYAPAHLPPPIYDWGVKPQVASAGASNECVATIPAILRNTEIAGQTPINLAESAPKVYVILATGGFKDGQPIYHGPTKEVVAKPLTLA